MSEIFDSPCHCPSCGDVRPLVSYGARDGDFITELRCPQCGGVLRVLEHMRGGDPACSHDWVESQDSWGRPLFVCTRCRAKDLVASRLAVTALLRNLPLGINVDVENAAIVGLGDTQEDA